MLAQRVSLVSLKDKAQRHKKRIAEIEESIATCGYSNERHLELSSIIPVAEEREEWQKAFAAAEKEYRETKVTLTHLEPIVAKEKQKWERSTIDLKATEEALQSAKKQYEASKKIHGSADAILQVIKDLQAASEQVDEKEELLRKIDRTDKALADAKEQIVQLTKSQEDAEAALREARSTLEHLQEQHAANEIRGLSGIPGNRISLQRVGEFRDLTIVVTATAVRSARWRSLPCVCGRFESKPAGNSLSEATSAPSANKSSPQYPRGKSTNLSCKPETSLRRSKKPGIAARQHS
jgi:hypothetical protein